VTTRFAIVTNDLQVGAAIKDERRQKAVAGFLPRQISLLNRLRALGVPVFHLQLVEKDPRSPDTPDELRFTRGSKGVQMLDEVLEPGDRIIEKPKDSGFFETELDQVLKSLGTQTIIVSGMQAQICVQTTAADAYFRGYTVIVPSDCIVSSRQEDVDRALQWLSSYCAKTMTSDELVRLVDEQGS
jgi:nicotinamidase-related amidase